VRLARSFTKFLALFGCLVLLVAVNAPAGSAVAHDPIQGSGSSWSALAVNQWVADVVNAGMKVTYTPSGSAVGRKDFAFANTDFGVTDIGYQGVDPISGEGDTAGGRLFAYLPIVAGGTSFPYHVNVGGQLKRNIRLSGLTLAKIFTNQITNWNDQAITADNNGVALPSKPIIPVVHSEGSGSTAQFTQYLDTMYPSVWRPFAGAPGMTEYYPRKGSAIAQDGSDQVMNFIDSAAGDGAIGFDEYAYALGKNYPVIKLENAAHIFTLPNQYNVAVALTHAQINMHPEDPNYLLQKLDQTYVAPEVQAYPLSSYSYAIIPIGNPDKKNKVSKTPQRQTLADFLFYSVCEGQVAMGPLGYSPLPLNLVRASFDQTAKLKAADPAVDIGSHDEKSCHNPTFDPANPSRNHLAEIAPTPPKCDQRGQGPCTDAGDTGTAASVNKSSTKAPSGASTAQAGANAGAGVTASASTSAQIDPVTGEEVGGDAGSSGSSNVAATPIEVAAFKSPAAMKLYATFAALLLVLALVVPPLVARRLSARRKP
jgi:phosphate transport system substrate-binding protein